MGLMAKKEELDAVQVLVGVCFKVSIIVILAVLTILCCITVNRLTNFDVPITILESDPIANSITCPQDSNPFFSASFVCQTSISGAQCNFFNCDTQDENAAIANICICHKTS